MASRLRDRNRYAGEGFLLPSANLEGHWDASRSDTITIATGVSNWADISGNGNDLLQATGADQPSYANNAITFDGISQFLATAGFTLNQPTTIYFVGQQVSYTQLDAIFDGATNATGRLNQDATTPAIKVTTDNVKNISNGDFAVGTDAVIATVLNGASSSIKVNNSAASTGDVGAGNMGGFTLGTFGTRTDVRCSNIIVYEVAIYSVAHNAATQAAIIQGLMSRRNIS